jgi:hypothetical protein
MLSWHHVLKGKFLQGKRNRRLDHLLNKLLHAVVPYYSLKQRRQDLGLEGPDMEVRKRQDITKRSAAYTQEDIEFVEEGRYLVRSQSDPSRVYEVDIETYTCDCPDYPLISYCKHLCAVQLFFGGEQEVSGTPATPQVPSLASLPPESAPSEPATPATPIIDGVESKPKAITVVAEKLERLAARLRRSRKTAVSVLDNALANLEDVLDRMLLASDEGSAVLPSSQRLPPVAKDPTARQSMMPAVKRSRNRAGDSAYGAGSSSGLKAKKTKPAKHPAPPPVPLPSMPAPPQGSQLLPYPLQYYPITTAPLYTPTYNSYAHPAYYHFTPT